jgi:hypothetical protein
VTQFTVSGVIETEDISDKFTQNVTTIINIGSGISPKSRLRGLGASNNHVL